MSENRQMKQFVLGKILGREQGLLAAPGMTVARLRSPPKRALIANHQNLHQVEGPPGRLPAG
jgi:hypothetical protein